MVPLMLNGTCRFWNTTCSHPEDVFFQVHSCWLQDKKAVWQNMQVPDRPAWSLEQSHTESMIKQKYSRGLCWENFSFKTFTVNVLSSRVQLETICCHGLFEMSFSYPAQELEVKTRAEHYKKKTCLCHAPFLPLLSYLHFPSHSNFTGRREYLNDR